MDIFRRTMLFSIVSTAIALSGCGESEDKDKKNEEQLSNLIVIPSSVAVIPTRSVVIDGAESEWPGVSPTITDPSGDGGMFGGLDVTSVSLAQDNDSLYVKVNLKSSDRPTGDEYYNYWMYFESDNNFSFAIEAFHDPKPYIRLWNITGANRNYNKQTVLEPNLVASTSGSIMEFKVPKNLISVSNKYRVDFFTHYTQNRVWKDDVGDEEANTYGYFSFF